MDDAKEPLGASGTVTTVVELSIEQRMARVESVLNDAIVNPPKMPDAEIIQQRIDSADGKARAALELVGATDSRLTEAAMIREAAASGRISTMEDEVKRLAKSVSDLTAMVTEIQHLYPQAQARIERDELHERRMLKRDFKCSKCTAEFNDVVSASVVSAPTRTCPNCGAATEAVVSAIPLETEAA